MWRMLDLSVHEGLLGQSYTTHIIVVKEYLEFRHVFRNIYGFELLGDRILRLKEKHGIVFIDFIKEINDFLDKLDKLTKENI